MPLKKSTSKKALGKNIAAEERSGKAPKVAEAIALSEQREAVKRKKQHGRGYYR